MKKYTYIVIALVLGTFHCFADGNSLAPTGLTLVVTDSANRVLDTVVVVDDKGSRSVTFKLPKNLEEIRVFAIGARLHKDFPKGYFITGRPKGKKGWGLGYVKAHIEKGVLVTINGNGAGLLKLSDTLKAAIKKDLKDAKSASITTVKLEKTQP